VIRAPRVPRPSRPIFLAILVTALLAFPMGIALASHQFSDVPDSNPFHDDIDALVDSGVTLGCGGGKYCPKAYVNREQMAAFLNRLGSLDGVSTPSVDAASVDGLGSEAFHRYDAVAPLGAVQYGFWDIAGRATAAGQFDGSHASFSVPLLFAPTPHVITPGDPVPTGCSGTAASPSASAGHLCIWVAYELNTDGSYSVFSHDGSNGTSRFGFAIDLSSAGSGNYVASGTWAVGGNTIFFPFEVDSNATFGVTTD